MKLKKYLLVVCLLFFCAITVNAQESEGVISSIDDFSINSIEYNPNGIKILAFDNTLMLHFKDEVSNLRYEVINMKGKVLLSQETKTAQESLLNISSLKKGNYYVRVFSDNVKDLLKFTKK